MGRGMGRQAGRWESPGNSRKPIILVALADGVSGSGAGVFSHPAAQDRTMANTGVAKFGRGGTIIVQNKYPDRAGAAPGVPGGFNLPDQRAHVLVFAFADFAQGIPEFRLQAHAGPAALGDD